MNSKNKTPTTIEPYKVLVIYHGNCMDGFTAAWCAKRYFDSIKDLVKVDVEFHAGTYGNPPPDVKGKTVYILDYSFKPDVMEKIIAEADKVIMLDHHKTAMDTLSYLIGTGTASFTFDMNRSGAHIAWDYFFPDEAVPDIVLYVEDRDLWKFNLPFTREIVAAIFSYPYTFEAYDEVMLKPITQLIDEGTAIERKHFKDINELLAVVKRPMNIGEYVVNAANLPYTLSSDAGATLIKSGEPFGACYYDTPDGRVFSLRSVGDFDVAKIAESYGGGGHKNASGFKVPFSKAREMEDATPARN